MIPYLLAHIGPWYHWFAANLAPYLAATLIPTVIAGLSSKTSAGRLGRALKALARFCGWATHHDELGTLKLPAQELLAPLAKWLLARAGVALALVGLTLASSACATSPIAVAYQTLANVSSGSDAALKAFEAYDKDYQLSLVAADKKAGKAQPAIAADLAAYRAKRAPINKGAADVSLALAGGHVLIPLVQSGVNKQSDLDAWMSQLLAAWSELQTALAGAGIGGK